MDTAQWPQGIGVVTAPMESIARPVQPAAPPSLVLERRAAPPLPPSSTRPQKEQALNCPRCNSSNTKFCYYNNYSLSQPRYFCKTCRRYWTEGGSLRNVPIGGGSRKNKRSPSSSPNTTPLSSSSNYTNDNRNSNLISCPPQTFPPIVPLPPHHQHQIIMNPSKIMIHAAGQDLNLAYPPQLHPPSSGAENYDNVPRHIPNLSLSAMELLKINSFPVSESSCGGGIYSASGFSRGEYKPALNFPVGGFESGREGYGLERGVEESSASGGGGGCRLLFPLEDSKQRERMSSEGAETHRHGNRDHDSSTADHGYWNGMLGTGGGSW